MATAQPQPAQAGKPPHEPEASRPDEMAAEQELALAPQTGAQEGGMVLSGPISRLPVELEVAVPVREFRMRNLLALEQGQVIASQWASGEDMPLTSGNVKLAWSEFEVMDTQLAVRVTRMV